MITNKHSQHSNSLADQVAHSAEQAIKSTQRVADEALAGLVHGAQDLHDKTSPLLDRVAGQANDLAQHGIDAWHDGSRHLRDQARHASESTVHYVKTEPVKSILIAAAAGAALMALITLLRRSPDRR